MKRAVFLVLGLVLGFTSVWGQAGLDSEILSLPKSRSVLQAIAGLGLDLLGDWKGRLYVVAPPADLRRIEAAGLPFRFETWAFARSAPSATDPKAGPLGAYHTGQELARDLFDLQARFPDLARVVEIGESLEARPIYALKVSRNAAVDEAEPAVLFLGCHHAREWISVEVPFLLGRYLLESYSTDPEVRRLLDASTVWIVPLVNPDGHDYSARVYRYWRKNRRDNGQNIFGVDLNRNYGYQWGFDDQGSSPAPASDVFRGKTAFSEPEARAVRDLFLGQPIGALVSFHSYGQDILYPWGYTVQTSDGEPLLNELARTMAGLIREVNGRDYFYGPAGASLYLTNGDTLDWAYAAAKTPGFTVELPPLDSMAGGFFNRAEDIRPIFEESLPAMLYLIDWAIDHPRPTQAGKPFDLRGLLSPRAFR